MKFAKELEEDLVPEWRAKYLNYKACLGKKKLKAVAKALRGVNTTPRSFGGRRSSDAAGHTSSLGNNRTFPRATQKKASPAPISIPQNRDSRNDRNSETNRLRDESVTKYGSFITTPPDAPSILRLPDPALDPDIATITQGASSAKQPRSRKVAGQSTVATGGSDPDGNAYEVGKTRSPISGTAKTGRKWQRRTTSTPSDQNKSPFIHRLIPNGARSPLKRDSQGGRYRDVQLGVYREFDLRQAAFFTWMDAELAKIESFYEEKEEEADCRLKVLRDQLHEMRDRRMEEIAAAKQAARSTNEPRETDALLTGKQPGFGTTADAKPHKASHDWFRSIEHAFDSATWRSGARSGKTSQSLAVLGSPSGITPQPGVTDQENQADGHRDFVRRRRPGSSIPYKQAKRKLKMALAEFYRALELLKSYALLNRTAFRKLNKKYDKMVQARPTGRYMNEKVNKALFVQSSRVDSYMQAIEDLYARYFERGNHKIAVGKLKSKSARAGLHHDAVYRNGLLLGAGAVFALQGIVYGFDLLSDPDSVVRTRAAYLLQIYAGYFLASFLVLLFCIDCRIWSRAKINYVFIFEFDSRHVLDWRQLSEIPCFFLFLEGVLMWLNFRQIGGDRMFIYYPVILIGLTLLVLFLPLPILYHRSRGWWLYSNWRLLLAGLYPVEFRDFFLGDMYCSLTYSMGNIELFFCLYAMYWSDPAQCNSTHSRLLGFFSTLPGIWRAMQCLRRYRDTRNVFPHLVNGGKYTFTILYYMSLSLYRIDKTAQLRALFITLATVNAIYCSIWDVAMDWSLGNPYAKHPFLRDVLGYREPGWYYVAMIIDPILRFNWIFYAIFTNELQHSAVLSFAIALSEIVRRGMWTLFRVENEHCTNVGRFRASRDVPLPYDLSTSTPTSTEQTTEVPSSAHTDTSTTPLQPPAKAQEPHPSPTQARRAHRTSGADLERAASSHSSATLRLRRSQGPPADSPIQRGIARVGTLMTEAHAQDFERKRRPGASSSSGGAQAANEDDDASVAAAAVGHQQHLSSDDDDDDDDDDDEGVVDSDVGNDVEDQRNVGDAERLLSGSRRGERS